MKRPYTALTVSYKLLEWAKRDDIKDLTLMKLQKMLFFIEGFYMTDHNENELIAEEFEAWEYGPVIRSVFEEFVNNGSEPINLKDLQKLGGIAPDDLSWMSELWNQLKDIKAFTFSKLLHLESSPWKKDFKVDRVIIPKNKISEYVRELMVDEDVHIA